MILVPLHPCRVRGMAYMPPKIDCNMAIPSQVAAAKRALFWRRPKNRWIQTLNTSLLDNAGAAIWDELGAFRIAGVYSDYELPDDPKVQWCNQMDDAINSGRFDIRGMRPVIENYNTRPLGANGVCVPVFYLTAGWTVEQHLDKAASDIVKWGEIHPVLSPDGDRADRVRLVRGLRELGVTMAYWWDERGIVWTGGGPVFDPPGLHDSIDRDMVRICREAA